MRSPNVIESHVGEHAFRHHNALADACDKVHSVNRHGGDTTAHLRRTFAWLVAFSCLSTAALAAPSKSGPHVVLFLADDLSRSDCSIYNPHSGIPMPNLERIAHAGMTFNQAVVASPSCAPSRGALLTGLSPARNGAMFNHTFPDPGVKRWPAYFRDAGYETVSFGKTAHGRSVRDFGFDHVGRFTATDLDRTPAVIAWLEQRKSNRPLCLLVGTNWPHTPWPAQSTIRSGEVALPPTQIETPETHAWRARYAQAVVNADVELGQIYDAVRRTLGEDTLFIFTSDHGSAFPFGKWNLYDDGIRTPLVMAWPKHIAAGSASDALVSWLDLLPTCLEATGAAPPPHGSAPGQISGFSFLPVLIGARREHREYAFATHSGDGTMNEYPIRALRTREWKYIRNLAPDREHHTHIDKASNEHAGGFWPSWVEKAQHDPAAAATLARYHRRPAEELYDLRSDPWELHNLAGLTSQAGRLRELRSRLDAVMREEGDTGLALENIRRPPAKEKKG